MPKKIRTIKCGRCKQYWEEDIAKTKDLKCPHCGHKYKVDDLDQYYEAQYKENK